MPLLAIETTCDETAAAVITRDRVVLSSVVASQDELHARWRGVVPEVASRAHVERIVPVIDEAVTTVQAMSSKPFWTEAKASPECYEEVPFAIKVAADGAGLPKVINGTIDSVYRTADGWKIVDYKTDIDVSPAMLQARYSDQLKAYADAWRRFTDGAVTTALVQTRVN